MKTLGKIPVSRNDRTQISSVLCQCFKWLTTWQHDPSKEGNPYTNHKPAVPNLKVGLDHPASPANPVFNFPE